MFLNRNLLRKEVFSPYISYKKAILDTYFEIALVSLQSRCGMVFSDECTWNTMNIRYEIFLKKSMELIFQTALSSGLLKLVLSMEIDTIETPILNQMNCG